MTTFGISLSSEEHGPRALTRFADLAAEAGLTGAWVSDHFHPWIDEQGESPMVWPVLGAIAASQPQLRLGTGVTCPTMRIHPAICAQGAATVAAMSEGGFFFGVGSGENLNEHILGDRWPPIDVRLEMLEEAVDVMRQMWTGEIVNHHGRHYTVEHARLYTLPDEPPPVYVSAFGPKAIALAARIGDGLVSTSPEPDAVSQYREQGGKGPAVAGAKVCWADSEEEARKLAHRLWPNMGLPGQLSQDLATPEHFMQASELVPEDAVTSIPLGPDPDRHAESLKGYVDAGFDEVYVQQIGGDQEGWLRFFTTEVLPRL
ncbi:MAG: TIGR03557 family F420-dependent LLM class oxidoreductase [Actinobacteria bacterium]|nr:TIGR03557 family F420-dependent LLM class oxidoreductase [Actinomycetota bacterium]